MGVESSIVFNGEYNLNNIRIYFCCWRMIYGICSNKSCKMFIRIKGLACWESKFGLAKSSLFENYCHSLCNILCTDQPNLTRVVNVCSPKVFVSFGFVQFEQFGLKIWLYNLFWHFTTLVKTLIYIQEEEILCSKKNTFQHKKLFQNQRVVSRNLTNTVQGIPI